MLHHEDGSNERNSGASAAAGAGATIVSVARRASMKKTDRNATLVKGAVGGTKGPLGCLLHRKQDRVRLLHQRAKVRPVQLLLQ